MKTISTILVSFVSLLAVSCHSRSTADVPSCCAKVHKVSSQAAVEPPTGSASVYQLAGTWTDQHHRRRSLADLKGKVQVVAMIFTHCSYACPRIVQDMKDIADSLSSTEKQEVGYVLVSFDTDRDDPAQLARFSEQQGLDDHWELLHGDAGQVRELSMLLNVRYQQLEDRNFIHSNAIVLLDCQGRIRQVLEGLEPRTGAAVQAIDRLLAAK